MCVDHYPPHQSIDAYGKVSGYAVDFVERVLTEMKEPLDFKVESSLEACLALAKRGQIDLVMGLYKTGERESFLDLFKFSDGYSSTLFVTLGDAKPVEKLEDLENLRVGVIKGHYYFPEFDQNKAILKVPMMHLGQLIFQLRRHELDYLAVSQYQWAEIAHSLEPFQSNIRIANYQPKNDRQVFLGG